MAMMAPIPAGAGPAGAAGGAHAGDDASLHHHLTQRSTRAPDQEWKFFSPRVSPAVGLMLAEAPLCALRPRSCVVLAEKEETRR